MTDQQWIEINQNIKTETDETIKHKLENKIVIIISCSLLLIFFIIAVFNIPIPDLAIQNNQIQIGDTQGPN